MRIMFIKCTALSETLEDLSRKNVDQEVIALIYVKPFLKSGFWWLYMNWRKPGHEQFEVISRSVAELEDQPYGKLKRELLGVDFHKGCSKEAAITEIFNGLLGSPLSTANISDSIAVTLSLLKAPLVGVASSSSATASSSSSSSSSAAVSVASSSSSASSLSEFGLSGILASFGLSVSDTNMRYAQEADRESKKETIKSLHYRAQSAVEYASNLTKVVGLLLQKTMSGELRKLLESLKDQLMGLLDRLIAIPLDKIKEAALSPDSVNVNVLALMACLGTRIRKVSIPFDEQMIVLMKEYGEMRKLINDLKLESPFADAFITYFIRVNSSAAEAMQENVESGGDHVAHGGGGGLQPAL